MIPTLRDGEDGVEVWADDSAHFETTYGEDEVRVFEDVMRYALPISYPPTGMTSTPRVEARESGGSYDLHIVDFDGNDVGVSTTPASAESLADALRETEDVFRYINWGSALT